MRRHLFIPDTQVRPGCPIKHLTWVVRAILDYRPDVVVHGGDHWDMPSLSTHNEPGSAETEGQRIMEDVAAGNTAFEILSAPIEAERNRRVIKHRKRWNPELHFLFGNHENRITRAAAAMPKLRGLLDLDLLQTPGFTRHPFLSIVMIDGIRYCHYFANPHSGRPIGGTIPNRLSKIGGSFVQGHQQGFMYGCQQYPDHVAHGLVAGSCYLHDEGYRPEDVQASEWRGIVVMNEVQNGQYDLMPLSMSYLERKYG